MGKMYVLVRIIDNRAGYYKNEQIRCFGSKVVAQQECDRLNNDLKIECGNYVFGEDVRYEVEEIEFVE